MKLLTKSIEKKFEKYNLYSQDGKGGDAVVVCKFFFGPYTWFALEGQREGNDFTFFGIVDMNGEREYGYFSLRELESLTYLGYPCVERDRYFDSCKVSEL